METTKPSKNSQIRINVSLNEDHIPIGITWDADDMPEQGSVECKAFFLSLFEKATKETLRIDLWTEDMQVAEMDRMVFHTLRAMADTYKRSSQNTPLAEDLQRFAHYFGEQTEIIPKNN